MNDLEQYTERHTRWSGIALNQLSFANNFILTLATGFLAVCFNLENIEKLNCCCCSRCSVNWLYLLTLLFLVLSIMVGVIVIISRLYDFRITREVTLVRQRFYKHVTITLKQTEEKAGKLEAKGFSSSTLNSRCFAFIDAICDRVTHIENAEIEKFQKEGSKDSINKKLNNIRRIAHNLGELTWKGFKWQVFFFLFACIFFTIYTVALAIK